MDLDGFVGSDTCLYVSDLLLMADWGAGVGDSDETVLTELKSHAYAVSEMGR